MEPRDLPCDLHGTASNSIEIRDRSGRAEKSPYAQRNRREKRAARAKARRKRS